MLERLPFGKALSRLKSPGFVLLSVAAIVLLVSSTWLIASYVELRQNRSSVSSWFGGKQRMITLGKDEFYLKPWLEPIAKVDGWMTGQEIRFFRFSFR